MTVSAGITPSRLNPFDWPDVNAYHVARPFIVAFSFRIFFPSSSRRLFSLLSSLPRIFSRVARASALFHLPAIAAAATACNGLKGLHSNNRETNCRALARYRARLVGLAATRALVYHRSFCYGDVPLFSPRFRDSLTTTRLPPPALTDPQTSPASVRCRGINVADFIRIE